MVNFFLFFSKDTFFSVVFVAVLSIVISVVSVVAEAFSAAAVFSAVTPADLLD